MALSTNLRRILLRSVVTVVLAAHAGVLPAAAQGACQDDAQQVAAQQQQVAADQAQAEVWLSQVPPLIASAPAELLTAAAQGALPGVTPEAASTFGAIVVQIGAQVATWQAANTQTDAAAYMQDLLGQVHGWEAEYAALAPVQGLVPSLVQLSTVFAQLDTTVGAAQGDLALLNAAQQQLQRCQADAGPAAGPTPPPDEAPPDGGDGVCSVGGATGHTASECFSLETDAAYSVWAACTEQYFAAEDAAFRTGGDPPANTCDPAWAAAQDAIQQRWGAPPP